MSTIHKLHEQAMETLISLSNKDPDSKKNFNQTKVQATHLLNSPEEVQVGAFHMFGKG